MSLLLGSCRDLQWFPVILYLHRCQNSQKYEVKGRYVPLVVLAPFKSARHCHKIKVCQCKHLTNLILLVRMCCSASISHAGISASTRWGDVEVWEKQGHSGSLKRFPFGTSSLNCGRCNCASHFGRRRRDGKKRGEPEKSPAVYFMEGALRKKDIKVERITHTRTLQFLM